MIKVNVDVKAKVGKVCWSGGLKVILNDLLPNFKSQKPKNHSFLPTNHRTFTP